MKLMIVPEAILSAACSFYSAMIVMVKVALECFLFPVNSSRQAFRKCICQETQGAYPANENDVNVD